ncbi:MAG: FAD-dependent monooxygenase, partial [Alicyclobacillus sp.]|nr:FAD-dependent monooxygenase [Alicyclobacillus sp.]
MSRTIEVPFLVAGGGIGGLATALAIAQTNRVVHVLEQRPEFGEIGAGLQLGPNATRVLKALGVMDKILEYAVLPQRLVLLDAVQGHELSALDLGEAFLARYGAPYIVMHRADLLNVLLEACQTDGRVHLHTNQEVVQVQPEGDRVRVVCSDGTEYLAEAAVGADGLWSRTRQLLSNDQPNTYPFVAYRGTVPIEQILEYANLYDVVCWISHNLH